MKDLSGELQSLNVDLAMQCCRVSYCMLQAQLLLFFILLKSKDKEQAAIKGANYTLKFYVL